MIWSVHSFFRVSYTEFSFCTNQTKKAAKVATIDLDYIFVVDKVKLTI